MMIFLYFILLAIEIVADLMGMTPVVYCTKPLLMPVLAILFYKQQHQSATKQQRMYVYGALFFSLLGDVLLMIREANLFVFGLGAFLIAQTCYIFLFGLEAKAHLPKRLPFMLYSLALLYMLKPELPQAMIVPVFVYAIAISIMGIRAAERQSSEGSYKWVLFGAILFIISDSLIAINKFLMPIPLSSLWVMSTYGLAQFLIVMGIINPVPLSYRSPQV